MKKRYKLLSILIIALVFVADLHAQSTAHVAANIEGLNDRKIIFSYELNDVLYQDSVQADKGIFSRKIAVTESVRCTLSNSVNKQINIFVLEKGSVTINGEIGKFYELNISGSKENDLLNAYKTALYASPNKKPKPTGDEENDKKATKDFVSKQQTFKDSVLSTFVHAHPGQIAAAIAILDLYITYPNRPKAALNFKLLTNQVQQSSYGKRIKTFIDAAVNTQNGAVAANFSLADKNGKRFTLADFKGKYVLIDFWASWCMPCRKEHPNLISAYNQYKDKGFTIVGLSMDSSKENWLMAVEQDKLPWLQLNDPKTTGGAAAEIYGVKSLPANFLIDPTGKIVASNLRGDALELKLKELLH
jgi:peroxiredoxin